MENNSFFRKSVIIPIVVVIVIIIVVVLAKTTHFNLGKKTNDFVDNAIVGTEGKVTTINKATLQEVLEISELSTIEYTYNAIATAYTEDEEPKYHVAYEGFVTAGIDFGKIDISVDESTKNIHITIPDANILDTVVKMESMEYIFEDKDYNTETVSSEAYQLCQDDLSDRADKEEDMLSIAKENAVMAVEALITPWVVQNDPTYSVTVE